jgi:hypothetical protein
MLEAEDLGDGGDLAGDPGLHVVAGEEFEKREFMKRSDQLTGGPGG